MDHSFLLNSVLQGGKAWKFILFLLIQKRHLED